MSSEKNVRIIHKHDVELNWDKAVNFIPKLGEIIIYDPDANYSYARVKVGNGLDNAAALPFISNPEIENNLSNLNSKVEDLLYSPITITDINNNKSINEIGSMITSLTINWTINKTPKLLTLNDINLNTSLTSYTFNDLNLTSNATYELMVKDEREATAKKSTSISFINGIYYGVISKDTELNDNAILNLTRKLQTNKSITFSADASNNEYLAYAIPSRYGTPLFNVGGFDGGFHLEKSFQFTNASGYQELYDVYYSDNIALGKTTVKVS